MHIYSASLDLLCVKVEMQNHFVKIHMKNNKFHMQVHYKTKLSSSVF